MLLHGLDSDNRLQNIGNLYNVHESTLLKIIRKFCKAIRKHFQLVLLRTPNESQFRILALRFEQLHDICYIIKAINESHIFVLVLVIDRNYYY